MFPTWNDFLTNVNAKGLLKIISQNLKEFAEHFDQGRKWGPGEEASLASHVRICGL